MEISPVQSNASLSKLALSSRGIVVYINVSADFCDLSRWTTRIWIAEIYLIITYFCTTLISDNGKVEPFTDFKKVR